MSDTKQPPQTKEYVNVSGRLQRDAQGKDWKPLVTAALDPESYYVKGLLAYGYIRLAPDKQAAPTPAPVAPPTGPATPVAQTPLASTASAPDTTTAAPVPTPAGASDPITDATPVPATPAEQTTTPAPTSPTEEAGAAVTEGTTPKSTTNKGGK